MTLHYQAIAVRASFFIDGFFNLKVDGFDVQVDYIHKLRQLMLIVRLYKKQDCKNNKIDMANYQDFYTS